MGGASSKDNDVYEENNNNNTIIEDVNDKNKVEKSEIEIAIEKGIAEGMPDPKLPEYVGKAYPLLYSDLQYGWDISEQGLPAYVGLPNLGACQVFGRKGEKKYAVVFFNITATGFNIDSIVHPLIPPPRWGLPWEVSSEYVSLVEGVVKNISRDENGNIVVIVIKRETKTEQTGNTLYRIVQEKFTWEEVLKAQNDPTLKFSIIFKRFTTDNYKLFTESSLEKIPYISKDNEIISTSPILPAIQDNKKLDESSSDNEMSVGSNIEKNEPIFSGLSIDQASLMTVNTPFVFMS